MKDYGKPYKAKLLNPEPRPSKRETTFTRLCYLAALLAAAVIGAGVARGLMSLF